MMNWQFKAANYWQAAKLTKPHLVKKMQRNRFLLLLFSKLKPILKLLFPFETGILQ
jgi:hypothetical protein